MTTRRQIEAPQVSQFFERVSPSPTANVLTLEVGLVAPLYQIVRAFDETGEPRPAAQLDPDTSDAVELYGSGFYDADPFTAPLPGLLPGARVDPLRTNVFLTIGDGASRSEFRLYGEEDEIIRFSRLSGGVLSANGAFGTDQRSLSLAGINFNLILADVTIPTYPPNFLEDQVLVVRIVGYEDFPLIVEGIDPADATTLILRDDINVPAVGSAGFDLVLFPRQFDVIINGQEAWRPISDFEIGGATISGVEYDDGIDAPASIPISNRDTVNAWAVSVVDPGAASQDLSATVNMAALTVTISLATDGSSNTDWPIAAEAVLTATGGETTYDHTLAELPTPGSVVVDDGVGGNTWTDNQDGVLAAAGPEAAAGTIDYATGEITINWSAALASTVEVSYRQNMNTDAQVNAALATAFSAVSRSQNAPIQLETVLPEGVQCFDAATGPTAVGAAAFAVGWEGRIQRTEVGIDGNDIQVAITTAVGLSQPTAVDRIGDNLVLITLGTDGAGVFDPTKAYIVSSTPTTVPGISNLLLAADALLEIVKDTGSFTADTEYLTPLGLGDYRNHAGYKENIWGVDQTSNLENGLDSGGVEVYGGLLPFYSGETVNGRLYSEYRALRLDASPAATLSTTGSRPDFIEVRRNEVQDKLGEISVDNPAALAAYEYLQASELRRLFVLSPSEVSVEFPWGTQTAMTAAIEFAKRRNVYHLALLNDAYWMSELTTDAAVALGGTETAPLIKALRFYIPIKNFDTEPDFPVAAGGDANRNLLELDTMSASLDFPTSGVQVGDVVVFVGLESEVTANVDLQNDLRGFSIKTLNKNGSPFTVEFDVDLPASISSKSFTVYREGTSLYGVDGSYDAQRGADILYDWHQLAQHHHPRLNKHLADGYEAEIDGVFTELDGVYLLAKFMGAIARQTDWLPVSTLPYPKSRRIRGTSDIYDTIQQNTLSGGGINLPVQQAGTGDGPIFVRRDVSSDTSTKIFQRRTAGVSEDRLAIRTDRLIAPRLGPNLVSPQFLERVAIDISTMMDHYRDSSEFEYVKVVGISPITDEIREETGIDDSGIIVVYDLKHLQEAARAIVRYIVQPLS